MEGNEREKGRKRNLDHQDPNGDFGIHDKSDAMPSFTHFRLSHSIFQRHVPLKVPRLPEQFSRGWKVSWCRFVCFLSESASPPLTVPATSSFLFTHVYIHIDKMYARSRSRMCACVVSSIYRAK